MTEPQPSTTRSNPPRFRLYDQPKGIGGWLLLFVIGQLLTALFTLYRLPGLFGSALSLWEPLGDIPGYRPLLLLETIGQTAVLVAGAFGLYLVFRTSPKAPDYYKVFLGSLALYGILDFIGLRYVSPHLIELAQTNGQSTTAISTELSQGQLNAGRTAAYALIWFLYWRSSQRVTNTFRWPYENVPLVSAESGG